MDMMPNTVSPDATVRQSEFREPTDLWSIPVFRWDRGRVTLSYSVFIVAAIVLGISLNQATTDAGNLSATGIALVFWVSGWFVQAAAYTSVALLVGSPMQNLAIGFLGVKTFPRCWSPAASLATSLSAFAALFSLSGAYFLAGGGVGSNLPWIVPSIGVSPLDSPLLAAAWLCMFQSLFQLFPLAHSLGRASIVSLVALSFPERGAPFHVGMVKRVITVISIFTVLLALRLMVLRSFPNGPIVLLLGITLWISTKSMDLSHWFAGFDHFARETKSIGVRLAISQMIQARRNRRRIKQVFQAEHQEAVDAAKLDIVLTQLHDQGVDSLSKADRELLMRVSERVRKERQGGS